MWIYTARIYSRKGTHVTSYTRAMSDEDYAIPAFREANEELAKRELLSLEGVTPDTPVESDGWRKIEHTTE